MNIWALLYAGRRKQTVWETRFRYCVWSGGAKAGGSQTSFYEGLLLYSVRKSFILFSEQTAAVRRDGKIMPEGTI